MRAVLALGAGLSVRALNEAPRVVRGRVTLDGGSLVVRESDVLLARGVVADARALGVVGIPYPCIIRDAVGTLLARHALRTLRALFARLALFALLALVALLHLQQPVRVALGGFGVRAVLVDAEPDASVVADAVVEVIMPRRPRAPVVGGADGRTVGLGLHDGPGEIDGVQVHGVSGHLHPVNVQVREVAVLEGDVGRCNLPRVLLPQHTGIGAGLVDGGLAVFVREAAIGDERHLLERVEARCPPLADRAHLVLELLVSLARHFRNGEVHRAEPGEAAVAPAVVVVLGGVVTAVHGVVDAHADVPGLDRSYLPVLQLQRACLVLRVHRVDDAHARCPPLVAHLDIHAVVHQQRHGQRTAYEQVLHLAVAVLVYLRAEACQAGGEAVFAEDGAFE